MEFLIKITYNFFKKKLSTQYILVQIYNFQKVGILKKIFVKIFASVYLLKVEIKMNEFKKQLNFYSYIVFDFITSISKKQILGHIDTTPNLFVSDLKVGAGRAFVNKSAIISPVEIYSRKKLLPSYCSRIK